MCAHPGAVPPGRPPAGAPSIPLAPPRAPGRSGRLASQRTLGSAGGLGGPVVLEQKTTILWKCLYLLVSFKDPYGLSGVYETDCIGGEENSVQG
jgi:hypothetical protein